MASKGKWQVVMVCGYWSDDRAGIVMSGDAARVEPGALAPPVTRAAIRVASTVRVLEEGGWRLGELLPSVRTLDEIKAQLPHPAVFQPLIVLRCGNRGDRLGYAAGAADLGRWDAPSLDVIAVELALRGAAYTMSAVRRTETVAAVDALRERVECFVGKLETALTADARAAGEEMRTRQARMVEYLTGGGEAVSGKARH